MERKWTKAQEDAMITKGRTLLISAAAGSGKTATLTERIIRRLTDPTHPAELSRLLIVTFTRAAASELRERIATALSKASAADPGNRHLQRQLIEMGGAHISTIDSFMREPVKAHFAELGMPATTRIADDAELEPLRERIMGEIIDDFYIKYASAPSGELFSLLSGNPFADLCDALTSSKNDSALIPILLELYNAVLSFPAELGRLEAEADALEREADGDFFASAHGGMLREWLGALCASHLPLLEEACALIATDEKATKAYGEAFGRDLDFCRRAAEVRTYAEAYLLFTSYESLSLKALRSPAIDLTRYKDARTAFVKTVKQMAERYFADSPEEVARQMRETALMCRVLFDLLSEYDRRILAEKRQRGICDFTDNRRLMLSLLRGDTPDGSPLAAELRAQYDEVYIDEYQDVDELQDEIFRLVGGDHRFMVGDIKQSIYGFRGADPSVFARYRRELRPLEDGDSLDGNSIFMSDNFRCDEAVIRVTNAVCGHIFRACPESVGYRSEDDLGFAKKLPTVGYASSQVEVAVLKRPPKDHGVPPDADEDGELGGVDAEAMYVANEIATLLRGGARLADGTPIRPKDIAILMRTKAGLAPYMAALTAMGIPTGSDELDAMEAGRDLLHGGDMIYLVNLMRVIDDPDRDIPLSEVLRAPFPGLSLEEVLAVRRGEERESGARSLYECLEVYADRKDAEAELTAKLQAFLAWVEHYRALCATHAADGILRMLKHDERCACRRTDAFGYLYESARTCRTSTFVSLYTFLRYFEKKLMTEKNVAPMKAGGEDGGHVTIMTIHKSKGLEFPVCFVVRCGQTFNSRSVTPDLIFEKRTGVGMKLYRREPHEQKKIDTTLRAATALSKKLGEREEEMRLLYVAMTRARERLYLVGIGAAQYAPLPVGDRYAALSVNDYFHWVLPALEAHPEIRAFFRLQEISTAEIKPGERLVTVAHPAGSAAEDAQAGRYRAILEAHEKPDEMEALLRRVPTKVSASRMRADLLDACVFYDTDAPEESDGKLPSAELLDGGAFCDARTVTAIRESLRLMTAHRAEGEPDEFELLLNENRRPTPAEKGTAAHLFLQYCDYDRVVSRPDGLEEEIARLGEEGFLNARTVRILDRATLRAFFDSRFFARMRDAVRTERELRFNRFVPLASLTSDEAFADALGERTLYVQGSIDLLCEFPDGHIELCDYKTDRITPAERADASLLTARMTERHGEQLRQYAAAVTEMYGRAPERVYIYSLPLGEAVEISL